MNDRPPLHDYSRSRAVVIGTSDYTHMLSVPAVTNSLSRIVDLLTGPLCGWPEDRLLVLPNERGPGDLTDRLIAAFEDVSDIAVFYYIGHGQIDMDDHLCLGLVESRTEPNRRASTSLEFQAVRRALFDSPAATKIVILDCCFAGLANQAASSLSGIGDHLLDIVDGAGAYTMTASGAYSTAWYETDPKVRRPQTYFTQYLADSVEKGIPDEASKLRLHALFIQLRKNLESDQRPIPRARSVDGAREFHIAYNAAPAQSHRARVRRVRSDLDTRLGEVSQRLTEVESREEALRTKFNERSRQLEELQQQAIHSNVTAGDRQQMLSTAVTDATSDKEIRAFRRILNGSFRSRRGLAFITISACVAATLGLFIANGFGQARAPNAVNARRHSMTPRISVWKYETAGLIDSSPVVAGGTVYVGSDAGIYALNSVTGGLRWADADAGAVDSSPKVADGTVYIGSFDGHQVCALSATTGRIRWTFLTGYPFNSSPFVASGTVYIGGFDDKVYALNAATGHPRWAYTTEGPIDSSPFVTAGTVYIGGFDDKVYALNAATGHPRWTYSTEGPVESSPVVVNGTVYVGSDDHRVYALNATTGQARWTYSTEGPVKSSPIVVNGTVYIGSDDDQVYALNATTGQPRWTYSTEGPVESSPVVVNGTVYVGSDDHRVYALSAATGRLEWIHAAKGAVQSSPVVANGTLYIGSSDDNIYALNANTGL
jgi:outer membrane protein assembly factor BamB